MSKAIFTSEEVFLTEVKFLLRRIENDIEVEESLNRVISIVKEGEIDFEFIEDIINRDVVKKGVVFNALAVECFKERLYNEVIPMLKKAMEIEKGNESYIYNMGFVLNNFGEKELALKYLDKIQNKDENLIKLMADIKG